MLIDGDKKFITQTGRSIRDVAVQVAIIKEGKKFVEIAEPATIANGRVIQIPENRFAALQKLWSERVLPNAIKFVPASGAATRMFRALNFVYSRGFKNVSDVNAQLGKTSADKEETGNLKDFLKFWNGLFSFPFFDELKDGLASLGISIQDEMKAGSVRNILRFFLTSDGMNYSSKPKLLLTFHTEGNTHRLAMEEQVKEAVWLTGGRVHFTISPEFLAKASDLAEYLTKKYAERGIALNISFSVQDPSTDTVALTADMSDLYRTATGDPFFRQSGHGALGKNLNATDAPYIVVQNVDNLPGGSEDILMRKKVFMGYFAEIEAQIFGLQKILKSDAPMRDVALEEAYVFIAEALKRAIDRKTFEAPDANGKKKILFDAINRPLVLAAVVPNVGEPGGGPFAVRDIKTGAVTNQIVEQAQQNLADPRQASMVRAGTHFNPVLLMVGTRDALGNKYDLQKYAKRDDGYVFYVEKTDSRGNKFVSFDTGLWNGEIADMIILFVEMPLDTFGPAKTVLDLNPNIRPFRREPYPEIVPEIPHKEVLKIVD